MKTIDTKGFLCPKPLIMTKTAMKEMVAGEEFKVISDNETAKDNLVDFLTDHQASPEVTMTDGVFEVLAVMPLDETVEVEPENYCRPPAPQDYVVALKSDKMGIGDDDLGNILIKGYVNTLRELEKAPTHVILYNSGVKLAVEGSGVDESLKYLEENGVKIIVCGTCADFFNLKSQIKIGTISNMYVIAEALAQAGSVVYP